MGASGTLFLSWTNWCKPSLHCNDTCMLKVDDLSGLDFDYLRIEVFLEPGFCPHCIFELCVEHLLNILEPKFRKHRHNLLIQTAFNRLFDILFRVDLMVSLLSWNKELHLSVQESLHLHYFLPNGQDDFFNGQQLRGLRWKESLTFVPFEQQRVDFISNNIVLSSIFRDP